MNVLLRLFVTMVLILYSWGGIAYGIAWWRTRQPVFGLMSVAQLFSAALMIWVLRTPATALPLLLIAMLAPVLFQQRLTLAIQQTYATTWDLLVMRPPRPDA